MKLILDMNVSPLCVARLRLAGHEARHWSEVGGPRSADEDIMAWAKVQGFVVVTHDLDFTRILSLTAADGPSVVQIRAKRMDPARLTSLIGEAVLECRRELDRGAVVTLDVLQRRVRALPMRSED